MNFLPVAKNDEKKSEAQPRLLPVDSLLISLSIERLLFLCPAAPALLHLSPEATVQSIGLTLPIIARICNAARSSAPVFFTT